MKPKFLWIFLIVLFTGLALFAMPGKVDKVSAQAAAQAQAPTPQQPEQLTKTNVTDNDVNRVAKNLYCPVCPNTPLDVCQTQACKDWRGQIRDQLSSGWTDQQVMDYFVKQYGERVLAEPERGGFTSLIWMLPVLVVLIGLVLVWLILKRWLSSHQRSSQKAAVPQKAGISDEMLAKIEAEIRHMD